MTMPLASPVTRPDPVGPHAETIKEIRAARGRRSYARGEYLQVPPAELIPALTEVIAAFQVAHAAFMDLAVIVDSDEELADLLDDAKRADDAAEKAAIAAGDPLPPPAEQLRREKHRLIELARTRPALDQAATQATWRVVGEAQRSVEAREQVKAQREELAALAEPLQGALAAVQAYDRQLTDAAAWLDRPLDGYHSWRSTLPDLEPARRAAKALGHRG